jgi:hypothetical protein
VLTGQEKTRTLPVPPEDKIPAWTELRGNPQEENPEAVEEVHIPDYVMHDFGLTRRSRGAQ